MNYKCGAMGAIQCEHQTTGGCNFKGQCKFKCEDVTMSVTTLGTENANAGRT